MKLLYTTFIVIFASLTLSAQTLQDGLRYAEDEMIGSARFTGMSGAFSSLGGDLSAIGLNPAGVTTFSTNRISGTLSFFGKSNDANYFNNTHSHDYSSFDDQIASFDQIGVVWAYKSDASDWNKIAFAINYNKNINYGNDISIQGRNTAGNSVTSYFLDRTNGTRLGDIEVDSNGGETQTSVYQWLGENIGYGAQQAFLGYQSYLVNPVDPNDVNNTQYTSSAAFNQVEQSNRIASEGSKSSMDIAFGGTYQKKLQLGFSLTTYSIEYNENNRIEETGYDVGSDLQYVKFNNALRVEGNGIALKFGAIYKATNNLRLSLAFHSPEWLELEEITKQSVETRFANGDNIVVAPDSENLFAPYKIITPSKFIAGTSYVFGKKGLISIDYTYQDYASLHFKEKESDADTSYFDSLNDYISDSMQAVHKINIGGEMKLDNMSLRAGTFMSTSPYKNNDDLNAVKGYSLGLGYTFDEVTLDLSYVSTQKTVSQTLSALPDAATIDQTTGRFSFGLRYNF